MIRKFYEADDGRTGGYIKIEKAIKNIVCETYTSFHGEEIDNINQIKLCSFDGEELKDFCELFFKISNKYKVIL